MGSRRAALHRLVPVFVCAAALAATGAMSSAKDDRPSITVRATPAVGFSPTRVILTADITGGPDDYEQFYCAAVEWDMGDGNKSEQKADCDPYERGKSQIKRRYVRDQVFRMPGEFRVQFRLKQRDKVVGSGRTTVRIRPGLRDMGGM
jgi:hypothetical protein